MIPRALRAVAWISALAWLVAAPAQTPSENLDVGGAVVHLTLEGDFAGGPARLRAWVERAARIVSAYYGRFPAPELTIHVDSTAGARVGARVARRAGVDAVAAARAWCVHVVFGGQLQIWSEPLSGTHE